MSQALSKEELKAKGLDFSAGEYRIYKELHRVSSSLSDLYVSSKKVLLDTDNPKRYMQAAVCIRELIDRLPDLDKRVPQTQKTKMLKSELNNLETSWDTVTRNNDTSDATIDTLTNPHATLKKYLKKSRQFFEYKKQSSQTYKSIHRTFIQATDISLAKLPDELQDALTERWIKCDGFFNGVAHDSRDTTDEEFREYFSDLEKQLTTAFTPNTLDDFSKIDREIAKFESGEIDIAPDAIRALFQKRADYDHFFSKITSDRWLSKLEEASLLDKAQPAQHDGEYIRFLFWPPAEYLLKIAGSKPDEVTEIIKRLSSTDNASVQKQFIEIAQQLPSDKAIELIPMMTAWLQGPLFLGLPLKLVDFIKSLVDSGHFDKAKTLAVSVLALDFENDGDDIFPKRPKSSLGIDYEFLAQQIIPILLANNLEKSVDLLVDLLNIGLSREKTALKSGIIDDYSDIWLSDLDRSFYHNDPRTVIAVELYKNLKNTEIDDATRLAILKKLTTQQYKLFYRIADEVIGEDNTNPDLAPLHEEIISKIGKSRADRFVSTSWTGPESPKSNEELAAMSVEDMIVYANQFEPKKDFFERGPSVEGLGRSFGEIIGEKPSIGIDILKAETAIKKEYLYYVLFGLERASSNKKLIDWSYLLGKVASLLERLTNEDRDLLQVIMSLIQSGLNMDGIDVSEENQGLVWKILSVGLSHPDLSKEEEDQRNNDSITNAYNTVRGEAYLSLMSFLKRVARQFSPEEPLAKLEANVRQKVFQQLEDALDRQKEPTKTVHVVFGQELGILCHFDLDWVKTNASKIFPSDEAGRPYAFDALEVLLRFSQPFTGYIEVVRAPLLEYIRHSISLEDEKTALDRVVQFVLTWYMVGAIEYDDELVKTMNTELPAQYREQAIEFIGRSLSDLDPIKDTKLIARAKEYWEKRKADDITSEECKSFSWWVAADRFDDEWIFDNYMFSLENTAQAEDSFLVFKLLRERAEDIPERISKVLNLYIKTQQNTQTFTLDHNQMREIIGVLITTGDQDIIDECKESVNLLLAQGYNEFQTVEFPQ
jgi:hypothetical protein